MGTPGLLGLQAERLPDGVLQGADENRLREYRMHAHAAALCGAQCLVAGTVATGVNYTCRLCKAG